MMIYMYLPPELIPEDFEQSDFDEFFRVLAMAQIARELRQEDIEVGVNKGYVYAHQEQ